MLLGYLFCLYCVAFRWGAVRAKYGRLDLVRERIADGITLRRLTDRALDLRVADLASVALPAELGHGSEWQSAAFPSRSWVASASTSYIAAT
jgi:hypothetical protein